MSLLPKYAKPPNLPLPFRPNVGRVPWELVKVSLPPEWEGKPDIVLTIDAGICWINKPDVGIVAHVATDSHCLEYSHQRAMSDKFFNMQKCYMQKGDIYLPYAFDNTVHYVDNTVSKDADAVLIGMPYTERVEWVNALRAKGVSVLFENGPVFDEYRTLNNRAKIGLNWSSLQDLNARVFEIMAMKLCPVINRVPDSPFLGFMEGEHYLGFDNLQEAVEKVLWAKKNELLAEDIANQAHHKVWSENMTYSARVDAILKECGF
jgi:hypothetical protein